MSTFDADAFMEETYDEALDTKIIPVPAGTYNAQIDSVTVKDVDTKDGPRLILQVVHHILDDLVKELVGRDKPTVRQDIWLDTIDGPDGRPRLDNGKGKNVSLGKLRAACNLNNPGQGFNFTMLTGQMVKVTTGLRPDKNDPEIRYAEVKTVGKAV